jgi:hypothetical protein
MSRNRDSAAAFGVMLVALHSLAAMTGYFAQHVPVKFHFLVWILTVLILIFIPLVRGTARWTALGAGIAGIILVIWILFELTFLPPAAMFGPILGLVLAVFFAFFSFRAYLEKATG